ncbi:RcnB family protein [Acidocella sp.]|uniref:RcnB family protein n=1 Tax=Acidocella sp. TaxID=50710 RepID=UPI00260DAA1F|nr:RcnB family protein [Acidocella sp.]
MRWRNGMLGLIAALAVTASPVLAQPRGPGYGPPPHGPGYYGPPPPRGPGYYGPPPRHWAQGDRFEGNRVVINNYNYYHLRPPPYGYQWVYSGGQFLMVAIATGVIAAIVAGSLN